MIRVYPFRPWSFNLPDGTECSCDTLDEILYLAANLKDGEKATIVKNSHPAYLERVKVVENFNKQQAAQPTVSTTGPTVTIGMP